MKKVILSCLKMNLKISHKLNLIYLYIKGFKKSKIDFWYEAIFELVQSLFWYLFKPIMCEEGWCVELVQEEIVRVGGTI